MRIAVTYDKGEVFQHFGRTKRFKVYDIEENAVKLATTVNTDGTSHGALADVLKKLDVNILICGGLGTGARRALEKVDIKIYGGVKGSADKAVDALLDGSLKYDPDIECSHHDNHDKTCGSD